MKRLLVALAVLVTASGAMAQSVQQSGTVTPNTIAIWNASGVIKGGATAIDSPVTNFGVTRENADGICVSSARQTAVGRNTLCLLASTTSAAKITLQNYGTATAQNLQFVINGTAITLPTGGSNFVQSSGTLVSGHMPCWSGTSGLVVDCGVGAAAGTQYGLAYYSAAGTIGSMAAGTNGQIPVATTSGAPNWRSLSGDVASVSAAGAVVLQSVNGVTYPSSYSANGVVYATSTSAVGSTVTSNTGYCLLSQGLSSAPIWAACASGAGSAGGSDGQVQFNSATSLGGSASLTWSSPTLSVGAAGSTTGILALSGATSGTVSVKGAAVAGTYNFILPISAGSSGQPMISGGGGSTAMSFGTLGVSGGGTNCAAASGTCLDNITGFSSTGYVNRTGSGTYAFSTVIPVSGGGTNLASGTSGGILGYTASGTLASSVLLTQYGVVYGGGAGATPVATAAGTNGQLLIGQTGAAPAFTTMGTDATISAAGALTIANSAVTVAKMANAAANTLLGNFTAGSTAPAYSTIGGLTHKASPATNDLLVISDQAASGAIKYCTIAECISPIASGVSSIASNIGAFTLAGGVTNSTNQIQADVNYSGMALPNCTIAASAAASALTIALKDNAGSDPSATSPCYVNFRNATPATGSTTAVTITAATSLVISSGSTLGVTSSTAFRLWVVIFNDAGTARIGVINASTGAASANATIYPLNQSVVASSTAEGGAGAADSAGVFYTGTAVSAKAFRVVGYLEWSSTGLTAGAWTTAALLYIQPMTILTRLPGQVVQMGQVYNSSAASITTSTFTTSNLQMSVTPTSAANLIKISYSSAATSAVASNTAFVRLYRGAAACTTALGLTQGVIGGTNMTASVGGVIYDKPNSASSVGYVACFSSADNASSVTFPYSDSMISVEEIQG